MEKYKINGKRITMPTSWADVSYNDALNIFENNLTDLQVFSLFSGIPMKEVKKLKAEAIYYFMQSFLFLKEMPNIEIPQIPRSVKIGDQRRVMPFAMFKDEFDLGQASVNQVENMKIVIQNYVRQFDEEYELTNLDMIKMMPEVVAIYLQPIFTGEFDDSKIDEFTGKVEEMSFKDVYHIGSFFFRKLTGLTNGQKKGQHRRSLIRRKLKQVFWKSIRLLDSMQH